MEEPHRCGSDAGSNPALPPIKEDTMTQEEVIERVGLENWEAFHQWMGGQTVSVNPDGSTNYYDWDVEAFVTKLDTGYDRQKDPAAWD